MKLTEQQLKQLFQESTRNHDQSVNLADALARPNLSDAEAIASDLHTAQAAKLAVHFQPWSQQVANDIEQTHNNSWVNRGQSLLSKWLAAKPMTVTALAMVFTLSAVVFLQNYQTNTPAPRTDMVTNDVINSLHFEGDSDRLSRGGFDAPEQEDRLFDANFS